MGINYKKTSKISLRIAGFVLVQALMMWQPVWGGEREVIATGGQNYYLCPHLQINNLDLQPGFVAANKTTTINSGQQELAEFSLRTRNAFFEELEKGSLKDKIFDVFICGGGIAGTSTARDCALRGLSTIVVSKGDWADEASGSSTKMLHGGVRYLELAKRNIALALKSFFSLNNITSGKGNKTKEIRENLKEAWINVRFVYDSLHERNIIAQKTPQITRPKLVYMVIDKEDSRLPILTYLGLLFYWFLSGFSMPIPHLYLRKSAIKANFPELNVETVKAVATFHEYVTDDAMLTLYTVKDAYKHGAVTLNYAPVTEVKYDKDNGYYVISVSETGFPSGETGHSSRINVKVKAKRFVNAAGAGIDYVHENQLNDEEVYQSSLINRQNKGQFLRPVIGMHVFIPKSTIAPGAMGNERSYFVTVPGLASGRKNIFIIQRNEGGNDYYLIDTRDWSLEDTGDNPFRMTEEIEFILAKINRLFPAAHIKISGLDTDYGIKPLPAMGTSDTGDIPREHKIVNILDRYFVMVGVKITDGRRAAEDMVNMLCKSFGLKGSDYKCKTAVLPLDIPDDIYKKTYAYHLINEMIVYPNDLMSRKAAVERSNPLGVRLQDEITDVVHKFRDNVLQEIMIEQAI